ncbi:dual specificity phosphatase [Thecamonas trahens ATCC 50062]|uniref:protein-tyrosine-phosphatase n=1 Tax=Thecamonas trahens ATCC 50062 TaxID=461836 RepID=A0A0L0DFI3_THETB|nr:dual specificity phosphatase [Thecamonas trahens ATCC 50062]KNC50921.1 dual specificity phosphatase [Thecamonas trahens ATCC 50062]|eukprot:XP_013756621.1 dual specificity phosphatase [Thecamonas trahens ATCC 50062]
MVGVNDCVESIGALLNLTFDLRHPLEDADAEASAVACLHIAQRDEMDETIAAYVDEGVPFIAAALDSGSVAIVFCQAGISRSATAVLAFLMIHGFPDDPERQVPRTLADAMDKVKAARPNIGPNASFIAQLLELEADLFAQDADYQPSLEPAAYAAASLQAMLPDSLSLAIVRAAVDAHIATTPGFSFKSADAVNALVTSLLDALL